MDMTKPQYHQFGLSEQDVIKIEKTLALIKSNEAGISWMDKLLPEGKGCLSLLAGGIIFLTILSPFFLPGLLLTPLINAILRFRLNRDPKYSAYLRYNQALLQYERTQKEHWTNLSGHEFEHELASVFRALGYNSTVTKGSGDEGIDIILAKNGVRTIVQCKQHNQPVGPSTVRELYGTLSASNCKNAILACTGGFTKGVYQFARGKPIELLDLDGILELQRKASSLDG